MEPVIAVEDLTKRYGHTSVVDGVCFEVERGEIFGILGRNGAGKTTTVECLQGLRRADGGRMRVLGLDPLTQATELRKRIGSQLQESALPQRIKVWEALKWFAVRAAGTSVVLVTHFMEEAERLCDRVAVLERGKIIALDTPGALIAVHTRQTTVRFSANAGDLNWLAAVGRVDRVTQRNGSVEVLGTGPVLAEVGAALVSHGIRPLDLRADQPNLEDVFLSITGLRSGE